MLLKSEGLQEGAIQEALASKDAVLTLMNSEQLAALALLKARAGLDRRLLNDMERSRWA